MTTGGTVALVTLLLTNMGTVIAAWITVATTKRGIAKENANRRIQLEEYVNDIDRYHRNLRGYLMELADDGVIAINRVDLQRFRPPPVPKYNGGSN